MIDIQNMVRPNISAMKPYSSARDEFKSTEGIFLDANENPYGKLNRYPDPYQKVLKEKLSKLKNVETQNIFIGNGSDEVIDLVFRIFCNPGSDMALTFSPTYGMYKVAAAINDIALLEIPLDQNFQIDVSKLTGHLSNNKIKLIFICSPNNPTGNLMKKCDIEYILDRFHGLVIIDEAYIDFAKDVSFLDHLNRYNQLIIIQTFSKARALAAARVGIAYAHQEIISLFNKVKPPYNVSALNQQAAIHALHTDSTFQTQIRTINQEKAMMNKTLAQISFVKKIYPSDANFIFIEVTDSEVVYHSLVTQGIIIRNRNSIVQNCLRITVGTPAENNILINALKNMQ